MSGELALSIRQPWASAIVEGGKDIENRSWPTRYRGPILIHAGKVIDGEDCEGFWDVCDGAGLSVDWLAGRDLLELPRGGIVGRAEIMDCVTASASPWFFGRFGFVLRRAEPVDFRPCPGRLGLFVPDYTPRPAPPPKPRSRQSDLFGGSGQ